jgi:DNA-binding transcriptional regulator YhcF (GntR family)
MYQDLPMKEYMLDRMGMQRAQNWTEITSQIVNQYGGLIEQGANPEDAILATADTMASQAQSNKGGVQDVMQNLMQGGMLQG